MDPLSYLDDCRQNLSNDFAKKKDDAIKANLLKTLPKYIDDFNPDRLLEYATRLTEVKYEGDKLVYLHLDYIDEDNKGILLFRYSRLDYTNWDLTERDNQVTITMSFEIDNL